MDPLPEIENLSVCLIYRDPVAGGKSIEEIFDGLSQYWKQKIDIIKFEYDSRQSFRNNFLRLRKLDAGIYHITGGVYFLVSLLRARITILTIHDIGRFKELKGIKRIIYKWIYLSVPLRIATHITTVSTYTQNDILTHFGKKLSHKISIIHNPVPEIFKPNDKLFNHSCPRILQVGTSENKNIKTVIEALKGLNCFFVILGRLNDEVKQLLAQGRLQYENHVDLSYQEVYIEYCKADLVIFASVHEGFGMPVLEANAVGRSVIASRLPAIEEVGGEAIHYINNPLDAGEIRQGISRIITDVSYRESLISRGKQNINRFQIDRIAAEYTLLYQRLFRDNHFKKAG